MVCFQDGRHTQATETNDEVEFYLQLINFLVWDWAKFSFDYLTTLPQILETLNKYTTRIQIVGLIYDAAFVWGKIQAV